MGKKKIKTVVASVGWGGGAGIYKDWPEKCTNKTFWRDGNTLYFDKALGYVDIYVYQNLAHGGLKICTIHCMSI